MFMIYGALQLQVIDGPSELVEDYSIDYVEHAVISGKPQVQVMGDSLDRMTLTIHGHDEVSDANAIYQSLKSMIRSKQSFPLLFASGEYLGRYLSETLSITRINQTADGTIKEFEAELSLVESAGSFGGVFGILSSLLSAPAIISKAIINPSSKGGK